ncbi:MAG: DUF3604 domain-containing protein, partial [Pseudomonadota bacterium]
MNKFILSAVILPIAFTSGCEKNTQTESKPKPVAAQATVAAETPTKSVKVNPLKNVYWGDTHNHTGNSFDVFLFGTPNSTPEIAFRFARGEKVESPTTGKPWQLSKPLDFLVVADHAELLGSIPLMYANTPGISDTKTGKTFLSIAPNKSEENMQKLYDILNYAAFDQPNEANLGAKDLINDFGGAKVKEAWTRYIDTAEKYNDPGTFTTLIGWEWSSNNRGANLHRVVFMPQGGDVAKQFIPYSALESDDPEDLWDWLEATSAETGAEFVAIPHNPNISLGLMFAETRLNGEPIDKDYAEQRMKWERSVEITHMKGDSESHPALSPNDEFADY